MIKKVFVITIPLMLLASCGSDNDKTNNTNNSSSLIMNEHPTKVESNNLTQQVNESEKNEPQGPITSIEFLEKEFNFGKVFYPSENMHTFKFKNTGDVPLTIVSAKASCGCTIPNKPEEPIAPGEIGELDVIFRPKEGQKGTPVTKRITVVANTSPKETYINIKADVLKGM